MVQVLFFLLLFFFGLLATALIQGTQEQERNALYTAVVFGFPIDPTSYAEDLAIVLAYELAHYK